MNIADCFSFDVPEGWEARRLKTLASVQASNVDKNKSETERPVKLCNYTDVYYSDEIRDPTGFMRGTATPDEIARFRLRKGDVLVTKDSESWDDIAVPAFVRRDFEDTVCGYHLYLVRPGSEIHGRYLAYALESDPVAHQFKLSATGITRYGLSSDSFRNGIIPTPPLPDQKGIANFLDRETCRIDKLIDRKKRLIELLEEKRTALTTRAVTKGLDPDVPMKDSGVEWLGEIPEHWEVARTKFVARLESGHTPSRSKPEYWEDCKIPWFTLSDVHQLRDGRAEYVSKTKEKVSELGLANSSARLLPGGTVILSRTASVGFSAIMERPMATTQDFVNWVCGDLIVPEYLLYVFRSMKEEFRRLIQGSTHQTIYMPDVERFRTPLPTVEEQKRIVEETRPKLEALDRLQKKVRHAANLLSEYRTSLISAAVTGKIDVRDHSGAAA